MLPCPQDTDNPAIQLQGPFIVRKLKPPPAHRNVVMIAAGTGVNPMIQQIRDYLSLPRCVRCRCRCRSRCRNRYRILLSVLLPVALPSPMAPTYRHEHRALRQQIAAAATVATAASPGTTAQYLSIRSPFGSCLGTLRLCEEPRRVCLWTLHVSRSGCWRGAWPLLPPQQ